MRYLILILFVLPLQIFGQYTISGTVSNTRGENLSFATVYIPGTAYAASTDDQGKYIISDVAPDHYTIIVKFIGYRVYTQDVTIQADQKIDVVLQGEIYNLDAVEILANRVGQKGPFTKQNLSKETLLKENLGQDVPFILQWTPSMVVTSDAGTGIGYTGMRLRGSDQTRINVTLNGVPVNEAESHNVFWVDLPDLMGSAQSIQIQRGAGTSTNGAGAFGGTVSINTAEVRINPYVDIFGTLGAFNTQKLSVHVGTGLINDRYVIDGRYSTILSDGYVDRANAKLNSLFFSAARVSSASSLRLNVISGKEITYQSWNGVPQAKVDNDQNGLLSHYYGNVGSIYKSDADSVNLFASDRKYNYYTYANQIDNYRQTYVQLLHSLALKPNLKIKSTLYYTKGGGYYEEFKYQDDFNKYGIPSFTDSMGTEIACADIVRRRWLQTDLFGGLFDVEYVLNKVMTFQAGLAGNHYAGNHFGQVIHASVVIPDFDKTRRYYENEGEKQDYSGYVRSLVTLNDAWTFHGDLQLRKVIYGIEGVDSDLRNINLKHNYLFFNPKVGVNYQLNQNQNVYASLAIANKEPSRGDFIDNAFIVLPESEHLRNIELGYRMQKTKTIVETNLYLMNYKNQLVQTGELNDVGAPIRQNVADSYRLGWEGSFSYNFSDFMTIRADLAFSKNKIKTFEEVLFDYTDGFEKITITHRNTDISFSPATVGSLQLLFKPFKHLEAELSAKYVGKQFLDNTSNDARALSAFHYQNLRLTWTISSRYWKSAHLTLLVNNLFNHEYSSNGYTYSYIYGELVTENFLYPQAGRHLMMGFKVGF